MQDMQAHRLVVYSVMQKECVKLVKYYNVFQILTDTINISNFHLQVYTRLQKLGICLSHMATLTAVDQIGRDHDKPVLDWVHKLSTDISSTEVSCCWLISQ